MSGLWRHWYWQLSLFRLFWKSAWTPFVREMCSCAWCPKYLVLTLSLSVVTVPPWFVRSRAASINVPDAVCSGAVENLPGLKAAITSALITLVPGWTWRLLNLLVFPSVGLGPCSGPHSSIFHCHCTACAAVCWWLLCPVGSGWDWQRKKQVIALPVLVWIPCDSHPCFQCVVSGLMCTEWETLAWNWKYWPRAYFCVLSLLVLQIPCASRRIPDPGSILEYLQR